MTMPQTQNIHQQELALIRHLMHLSEKASCQAPQKICQLLQKHYQLVACTWYAYNPSPPGAPNAPNELTLRGQVGFDEDTHNSIRLDYDASMVGQALKEKKAKHFNLSKHKHYRGNLDYPALMVNYPIKHMFSIPLQAEGNKASDPIPKGAFFGCLCLYPSTKINADAPSQIRQSIVRMAPFIAEIYLRTIAHDASLIRHAILATTYAACDLNSFLYRVLQILQKDWGLEAASAYMLDQRTQTLRLGNTTGMANKKETKEAIFIKINNNNNFAKRYQDILACYEQGQVKTTTPKSNPFFSEQHTLGLRSIMYVPIKQPSISGANNEQVVGILKCVNRVINVTPRLKDSCLFDVVDKAHMALIAELIGTITKLFWRSTYISEDFEKTVHGIQNNVLTTRAALDLLERYGELEGHLAKIKEGRLSYVIRNSIGHMDALLWQIGKFSNRDRKIEVTLKETKLYGDVLAKALSLAEPLAGYFNVKIDMSNIHHDTLKHVKFIYSDPDLLITVFRNLLENAIKYSCPDEKCTISIWWENRTSNIKVFMQDNGIGINKEDEELIFCEGYRAEEAMRRVTSGASAGLGLYQCRGIMEDIGGSIELYQRQNPTIFCLTLPTQLTP